MKATFITQNKNKANDLLRNGWKLIDSKIAVASGGMSGKGLSDHGIEYVANKMRVEITLFILELKNAQRHKERNTYGDEYLCDGCTDCLFTGWIKKD